MEKLTNFEQFLNLLKIEHERQYKEADNLGKRLFAIENNLKKLNDVVEKITHPRPTEEPKTKKEFPKTFQEVLNILKTNAKDSRPDSLYLLWNWIMHNSINQELLFDNIKQEIATLKCMLITKAINVVDNSNGSLVHDLYFDLGDSNIYNSGVDGSGSLFTPSTLVFKSKEGADHVLKYFKEDWKQMYDISK